MQARLMPRVAVLVAIGAGLGSAALAQTAAKAPVTPEWSPSVTKEPATGAQELDAKQLDLVQKLTSYFNQMGDMKGSFEQTSPDGKRMKGRIAIKRPSFFRFEYNRPSRQLIISNGTHMVIQDLDLKTEDRWGLDKTPFRVVLRKDVDLMRDAKILDAGESDDRVYVVLQDKSPDQPGRLKLSFLKRPALELKEWITTDSQNLDTKVELTEFAKAEDLDANLFVPPQVYLQKLQQ